MANLFPIASNRTSLAVTQTGGHLSGVTFTLRDGRQVRPMHLAPWVNETLPDDAPPVLRMLRGDFFCAPFGSSDVISGESRVHGLAANGTWRLAKSSTAQLDAVLDGDVMGAIITKHVEVRPGEAAVYQRHTLAGGRGRLPVGHHAMLRAEHPLQLGFSRWTQALTPPEPVETPPHGRPLLLNDQAITDLRTAKRADGGHADLTVYPTADGYEAIWMLVNDQTQSFAWTAATSQTEGWIWFGLKNPSVLPQTLMWFSNGGRDYAPWNGRHKRVIGLEEICGYFHLSHAKSAGENPVAAAGSPTAVDLQPNGVVSISYLFGLADAPSGFGAVTDIRETTGGVMLSDAAGHTAFGACDTSFITGKQA